MTALSYKEHSYKRATSSWERTWTVSFNNYSCNVWKGKGDFQTPFLISLPLRVRQRKDFFSCCYTNSHDFLTSSVTIQRRQASGTWDHACSWMGKVTATGQDSQKPFIYVFSHSGYHGVSKAMISALIVHLSLVSRPFLLSMLLHNDDTGVAPWRLIG